MIWKYTRDEHVLCLYLAFCLVIGEQQVYNFRVIPIIEDNDHDKMIRYRAPRSLQADAWYTHKLFLR